jgi:ribose 5-phosphate isomerase
LQDALGLAAYNAGLGKLASSAKHQAPYSQLGFPILLAETRDYVDGILDGADILQNVETLVSEVGRLGYDELMALAERACVKVGRGRAAQK